MMTVEDIVQATFNKAKFGGYKSDEVDIFIDDVQDSYKELSDKNQELSNQVDKLNEELEKYRKEESYIRSVLMNAQKMADEAVENAKYKADDIVQKAKKEADKLIMDVKSEVLTEKKAFEKLKSESASFRSNLLNMYKDHLKMIDALPVKADNVVKNDETNKGKKDTSKNDKLKKGSITENIGTFEDIKSHFNLNFEETPDKSKDKFSDLKFGPIYDLSKDEEVQEKETEKPNNLFR